MTILGLPLSMFLVFVGTIAAGSLGGIHYVVAHVIMGKPFGDEKTPIPVRDPAEPTAEDGDHGMAERVR